MSAKQNSGLLGIPFQYMKSHEYKAWSEKKGDHLILVDLSGSLRDTEWKAANEEQAGYHYQPEIWFERIFSDHILPSFLSKVLYHPGDRLEVRVFGEDIEPLGNYSIDELFVTPNLSRATVDRVNSDHTNIENISRFIKDNNNKYSTIWLYTDGEHRPVDRKSWDWGRSNLTPPRVREPWLHAGQTRFEQPRIFLHVPRRVSGTSAAVSFEQQLSRWLKEDVEVVAGPPPRQALEMCR